MTATNKASAVGAALVKEHAADMAQFKFIGAGCSWPVEFPRSPSHASPMLSYELCSVPDIPWWQGDNEAAIPHAAAHDGMRAIKRESTRARIRRRIEDKYNSVMLVGKPHSCECSRAFSRMSRAS